MYRVHADDVESKVYVQAILATAHSSILCVLKMMIEQAKPADSFRHLQVAVIVLKLKL